MSHEAIWLIICGICFVGEIFTVSFMLFLPGIAALVSFVLALFNASMTVQVLTFGIITTLLRIFVRPFVSRFFKTKDYASNSSALVGKVGTVLKDIDKDIAPGQIKVAGEVWSAITEENSVIQKDTLVKIEGINGVKLLVKTYKED